MKYIVTKCVSIISLSTKTADSLNKPRARTISKFLLHAAYEELNLIQIVTYIHTLQMSTKTLRAQMGSKMLTRVPPDEIGATSSSEKSFSRYVSNFSFTIPVSSKYRCKKKNIEQTIFRLFVKFMYQDQSACIHRHNYDN